MEDAGEIKLCDGICYVNSGKCDTNDHTFSFNDKDMQMTIVVSHNLLDYGHYMWAARKMQNVLTIFLSRPKNGKVLRTWG